MLLQQQLPTLSPWATLIVAKGSGHDIQIDRPDTVIDAIRRNGIRWQLSPWKHRRLLQGLRFDDNAMTSHETLHPTRHGRSPQAHIRTPRSTPRCVCALSQKAVVWLHKKSGGPAAQSANVPGLT
jgi:hypothetical protein